MFRKRARNYFPFTFAFPPFDSATQARLRMFIKLCDVSQSKFCKAVGVLLFALFSIWLVLTGRSTVKRIATWLWNHNATVKTAKMIQHVLQRAAKKK